MRGECCERPEAQIRTEHSDGFSENETVQRDRFGEIRANRYRCDGSAKVIQSRTERNKRKAGEEEEESRLWKTVRCLKELENKKQPNKMQEGVEVTKVEVNEEEEEEEWMTKEESRNVEDDLDLEHVRRGREEEMNYMIKTMEMFEFGSWEDAT